MKGTAVNSNIKVTMPGMCQHEHLFHVMLNPKTLIVNILQFKRRATHIGQIGARTHTHTHTRMHTLTHTHTHTQEEEEEEIIFFCLEK